MPHDHAHHHHHHHIDAQAGDSRVAMAVAVNLVLSLAQIVGGVLAGSVALIADAIHNLSDAASLVIALAARRIARRPADGTMTFGYGRAEVVAALVNYTALILISVWLAGEAVLRLLSPSQVDGWPVVILAALGLAVNGATVVLTYAMAKDSMNIRAAFLHNLADAATSVAVMVGGALILLYGWWLVDPIVTLGISAWILWHALSEIGPVIRLLMMGTPPDIRAEALVSAISGVEGVIGVHHLHLWQIDEHESSVEAHLVARAGSPAPERVRTLLEEEFGIHHATLQIESPAESCDDAQAIGHAPHAVQEGVA